MEAASRVVFSRAAPISMGDTCISAIAPPPSSRDGIAKAAEHETKVVWTGEVGGALDLDMRHAENAIPGWTL